MTLSNYDPKSFETLNEFEESKKLLADNQHHIEELGDVIRYFNLEDKIGICLLHKHFDLGNDELLVEKISENRIDIKPEKRYLVTDVMPYMWRLVGLENGNYDWKPLEFVTTLSVSSEVVTFSQNLSNFSNFLDAFTSKLLTLGLSSVFGLALHHRSKIVFNREEKILLETENPTTREMTIRPVDRERAIEIIWTQTLWRFPKNSTMLVESLCDLHGCAGHCGSHSGGSVNN